MKQMSLEALTDFWGQISFKACRLEIIKKVQAPVFGASSFSFCCGKEKLSFSLKKRVHKNS
jgi:hypothetical protein